MKRKTVHCKQKSKLKTPAIIFAKKLRIWKVIVEVSNTKNGVLYCSVCCQNYLSSWYIKFIYFVGKKQTKPFANENKVRTHKEKQSNENASDSDIPPDILDLAEKVISSLSRKPHNEEIVEKSLELVVSESLEEGAERQEKKVKIAPRKLMKQFSGAFKTNRHLIVKVKIVYPKVKTQ